ncbi:MAG: hypothetical protein V7609_3054 [Verrucomicrobiota bacterium]
MSTLSLWSKVLFLSGITLISVSAAPQPGSIDPTFDPGRGPLGVGASRGNSALVQPDGKILVTGSFNGVNLDLAPAVVRFNPDGSLDSSFNASVLPAPTSVLPDDSPTLLALHPNGQILVAGNFSNSDGSARFLTRLNTDGTLDTTFSPRIEYGGAAGTVQQAWILSDGKILIGGRFDKINGVTRPYLARLRSDGSLDETFKPAVASSLFVIQSTGKLVVAAGTNQLVRLNADGSLDNTFVTATAPPNSYGGGLIVRPDDKLIWTTIRQGFIPEYQTTILRLNADGTSDPGFQSFSSLGGLALLLQSDGKLVINVLFISGPSRLNQDGTPDWNFKPQALEFSVAQQADGKLVAVGGFYDRPYGIRRLFLDGARDDSFAPEIGLTRIGNGTIDRARLLPNGKIVIAGSFNYIDRASRNRLAVLNSDGTLDAGFDTGALIGARSDGSSSLNALAVQTDGKILVAFDKNVVRLNNDGRADDTFHYSSKGFVATLGLQPDGRVLLNRPDGLVRLTSDGSLDSTFHTSEIGSLVFVQPDAKILLSNSNQIIRLNPDGDTDTGFNANGVRGFIGPSFLALQPDGKLLVGRFVSSYNPLWLTRLNRDGSIDQTFDPKLELAGVAAADQTGIYVSTNLAPIGTPYQTGIVRLLPDGSRDPNFGVTFNPGASFRTLLLQADGQLIVTGGFNKVNGAERHAIVRLNGSAPKKLANISTRARVGRAESVEIGGFIIAGNAPKKVIVRAIGPSLGTSGLFGSGVLTNPFLELHDATGATIAQNDDWRDSQEAEITESGLAPAENAESAIVKTLAPGRYTAVVQGRNGGEGIALVELYDLDPASDSNLANISTRGFVQENEGVMIAGFILRGSEVSTVVARALGPSLAASGVFGPLTDPILTLYNQSGSVVAENDDWKQTQGTQLAALGFGSTHDSDSALIGTLPPGSYTAIVRGANGKSGVGLVEIYHLE